MGTAEPFSSLTAQVGKLVCEPDHHVADRSRRTRFFRVAGHFEYRVCILQKCSFTQNWS